MIITIGREFGSGRRELGRRLSEILGIAYYDQEIITEIARRTDLSERYVQEMSEKRPMYNTFPIHTGRSFYYMQNSPLNLSLSIFQEQSAIIREMAKKSDCVIVGRCADDVLRESNPFRIFVYAEMESRLKRCRQKAPKDEHLSDKEMIANIRRIDKNRSRYYELYTGKTWGDRLLYDLCINTTRIPVEDAAAMTAKIVKK